MDTQTQASAYRIALHWFAIPLADVVAWADGQICVGEKPDPLLFEVSLSKNIRQATEALDRVSEGRNRSVAVRVVFQLFLDALATERLTFEQVALALHQLALEGVVPSTEAEPEMSRFSDALGTASLGYYGDVGIIKAEMTTLLKQYALTFSSSGLPEAATEGRR